MYAPNNKIPKYENQKLIEQKGEIHKYIGDFNTSSTVTVRINRKSRRIQQNLAIPTGSI